ncbi:MAG: tetratricopeptide repeat protein [Myxococcota bacterium]
MAELTVANYLGMLLEDPYDTTLIKALREQISSEPANRNGEEDGQDPLRLLEAARGGHERRGEFMAAAALMELEIELVEEDPEFRSVLLKELGRLRRDELMDDLGALDAYERLGGKNSDDPEVAQAVEQITQAQEKWREIAHRFVEEAREAADPRLKTSLLTRAASLVWQHGGEKDVQQADAIFDEALAADPSHLRTARQYALSLRERERWDDVVSVFVMAGKAARTREEKASAWLQAARVLRRSTGDVEAAADAYRKVLELLPTDEEALGALVQYFTDREAWDELAAMYESALRSRQKLEAEKGMLLQLAMVHWRFRESVEDAEPYFARLRKIDAAHPGMLDFYRAQIGDDDPDGRLLTILGDALRSAPDADRQLALARELGERADAAGRPERSLEGWKIVERLAPGDLDAREALQKLYESGGKWNALSESIRGEIDALPIDDKDEKVRLLRDLVPIYRDALGLDTMLIQVYAEILTLSPYDPEALDALASLYQSVGRWNELIQVLDRKAEVARDRQTQVALLLEVADLWVERFGNLNQATTPLEKVVSLQGDHLDALGRLKDIYTKKRKWPSLFNVLAKETELATDPIDRRAKKVEMAELATERLHQHDVAIRLWKEVLEESPESEQALDALEKISEREKDWETHADVLRARVAAAEGHGAELELLQRLGVVLMERLELPGAAAVAWERAMALDPDNTRVRRMLREAYVASKAWDPLEALFSDKNDLAGFAEVLNQAAENAEDPAEIASLSLRASTVYRDGLGEPQRALRSLERVLGADASNVEAARRLAPLYERDQKWSQFVKMLEIVEARLPDDEEPKDRLERLMALRSVTLERLRDPESSLGWASRAYMLFPSEPTVVAGLEESAEAAGAYDDMVALFVARLEGATVSDDERTDLQRRIAAIAGERLGRSDDSIRQLEAILEEKPDDEEAMAVLDRLYRAERRFADLRNLYERRLTAVDDPAARWVLLNEVAQVEEAQLGDLPAAAGRHWQILEDNPHDVDALRAVERLSQQLKQWDRLDAALEKRLQSNMADDDRLAVHLQLADLRRIHLEDAPGALECYREALELDGRNAVAIGGVESISGESDVLFDRSAALLDPAYRKRGDFDKLASLLKRRLERADGDERRSLRLQLAELSASELGDASGAYGPLESAFLDNPADLALLDRLGGVAEAANQHESFVRALVLAIDAGEVDPHVEVILSKRAAELYDGVLGMPEEAARFHRRVLEDDATDSNAFAALKQLYTKHEHWDGLRTLYQGRIESTTDAGAKLDLLLQLCFLFEEILDEPTHAISSYEQALELDPTHTPSRRALQRLYGRLKRWPELAELLRRDLDDATDQEAIDLAYELATLFETRLDRATDAIDHYQMVLESSPTHLRAQEGLERLMELPEERQRVAAILEPIFESQGAWGELANVLEVRLEDLTDAASRASHLGRIGELAETKLKDPELAFTAYSRAVQEDIADGASRADLRRLSTELQRHEARAALLEAGLTEAIDDYVKTELSLELAELWEEADSDVEQVERAYQRLLAQDEDNPDIVLKASRALERIHRQAGEFERLVEDLRRQLEFEEDAARRQEILPELGELLEGPLNKPDEAIDVHRQRLELAPADGEVLLTLERLYELRGRFEDLVEVLERRTDLSDDPAEQKALTLRIATTLEARLSRPDDAIATYREALSRYEPTADILVPLARLYESAERNHELLEVTELRADTAEDPDAAIQYRFEAAELMRTRTGEVERAFEAYQRLLDQEHAPSVGALEAMLEGDDPSLRTAVANRLLEHYRANNQYRDQVRMLEVIASGDDPSESVAALLRAAEISEIGLEDQAAAFVLTGRALRHGVETEALPRVLDDYVRYAEEVEEYAVCVETLNAIVPEVLDGDLRTDVRMRAAKIAEAHFEDSAFAKSQYQRLLEEQPDHRPSLDALLGLVEASGESRELVELLGRKAELVEARDERAELLVKQACLYRDDIEDYDAAIDAFDRALGESDHPVAYEGLEVLYKETRRWDDLAALYERQIDQRIGDPADVRHALGEVCLRKLEDSWRALDQFREALGNDPEHEPTVEVLEELVEQPDYRSAAAELLEPIYLRRMEWAKVTSIVEARLDGEQDPTQRLALLRHLGDVQESHLEDLDGALETYGRLFAEDPHDEGSQEKLTRLARSLGRWNRLAAIFDTTLRGVDVDDADTASLALTTAKLYDERLGELDQAAVYYRRALAYDPGHKEAGAALADVFARSAKWEDLLELDRERESFSESDAERVTILHEVARIEVEELDRPEGGCVTFQRILEIDPANVLATEKLDALLEAGERWDDLAAHLEFQVDNATEPTQRQALQQRLGAVTETRLADASRALDLYEDILADDSAYAPALEAVTRWIEDDEHGERAVQILEPIHREADHWAALVTVLAAKAGHATDRFEQAEIWREAGSLYEEPGQDVEAAFEAWGHALVAEPADDGSQETVDRLAQALGDWPGYIAAYEAACEVAEDPILQGALLRKVADAQDRHLGDPRASIATLSRILEVDPTAVDILDPLEGLQVMIGDWSGLAIVYERKLEHADLPEERAALLGRLAGLYEEQLGDPERAVAFYQQATAEQPEQPDAYVALDRLFAAANDGERLADVLEQRVLLESDPESKVEVGLRLAELYEAQLGRPEAACDALHAVLDADREHRGALEGLSRLYERQGLWQDLVDTLRRRADAALSDTERVELTHQLGNIMERELDDEMSAIAVYGQILRIDERHEPSVQALLRITKLADYREDAAAVVEPYLREQERWNDVATLLRLRADALTDPHEKASQLVALADVQADGRQDPNAALDALLQAIGENPRDGEVIDRAEAIARDLQRWNDVVDTLFGEGSASLEPDQGASLFARVGRISEEELGDHAKAIEANERALSLLGDDPSVLENLDRLFDKTEQWSRLHDVVTKRLDADDADRPTLLLRQGRLRAAYLDDLEGALRAYQQVMVEAPDNADALVAIQRLTHKSAIAAQAIDVLEDHHRDSGNMEEVVGLFEQRATMAATDAERVALFTEAAALWENDLDKPDQALSVMRKAVLTEPGQTNLVAELERLAEVSGQWEALRGLADEVASSGDLDRQELYALRLRSASWHRDQLGDDKAAERDLVEAIGLDPEPLEAHRQRSALLRTQSRSKELVAALRGWAKVEPDPQSRIEQLREAATLASSDLQEAELAAECYQELLAVDRSDADALAALCKIRSDQSRWNEVVGLLERRLDVAPTDADRASLAFEVGEAYRTHLRDPRAAIEAFEAALGFDSGHDASMDALETLYEENDRLEALRALLHRRCELVSEQDQAGLQLRLASLYEGAFGDYAAAIAMLREVVRDHPGHAKAVPELDRLFAARGQWDDLVASLETQATDADETTRRRLEERMAEIHADQRNDTDSAIATYERIHDALGPTAGSLEALSALHERQGNAGATAETLETLAEHLDGEAAVSVLHRAAGLWSDRVGDADRAGQCLERAYSRFPEGNETRGRLKAHLEARHDYQALANVLDDELATVSAEADRVALLRTISDLYREHLEDPSTAASYLEKAVALDGEDRAALVPLCDLYIAAGRQQDAIPILQQIIESYGRQRSKDLAMHHHRLGQALEASGDAPGALSAYDAAFKIDLTNVAILRDLGKLTHAEGDLDRAQKSFRALLLQKLEPSSGIQKADVYFYLGDIAARQDDKRKAITMLERALAEDASHAQASERLKQLKA